VLFRSPKESSEWRLRQFGDDLGGLVQRPGERGTAAYKAQTAVGQGIFGNVVGVLCLDDLHHIVVASAQKDLLDFAAAPAFTGTVTCGSSAPKTDVMGAWG